MIKLNLKFMLKYSFLYYNYLHNYQSLPLSLTILVPSCEIRTLDSKGNKLKEASVPTNPLGIHVKDGVVYVDHFGMV